MKNWIAGLSYISGGEQDFGSWFFGWVFDPI
jgi:hypothetical protein